MKEGIRRDFTWEEMTYSRVTMEIEVRYRVDLLYPNHCKMNDYLFLLY